MTAQGAQGSQAQGSQFESAFHELFRRLIEVDLGGTLEQHSVQASGSQYGKDVQSRFSLPSGQGCYWHFECKSHKSGALPGKEVADKLLDVARSSHRIDVWCLVAAHVEPSTWIDETFTWADEHLRLPFSLSTLSPARHGLKSLFACHEDLFEAQYPGEEPPPGFDRAAAIAGFETYLAETTRAAHARVNEEGWEIVSPGRILGSEQADYGDAYIRGLTATVPWEVATQDWSIRRSSVVDALVARITGGESGFDFTWLVGSGGEGKSTVMRQVAWEIASKQPDWTVLWTDAYARGHGGELPGRVLRNLADDARVLICIDESRGLKGGRRVRAAAQELAGRGGRVFVLVADRGRVWRRSPLKDDLSRGTEPAERVVRLKPLHGQEIDALLEALEARGMLQLPVEEARQLLNARLATGKPWLLPILMQFTDPRGRGFESILKSVIEGAAAESSDAVTLLLAASLTQAGGASLPLELATRLIGGPKELQDAMGVLTAEVERQFGMSAGAMGSGAPRDRVVTNHALLAEGYVRASAAAPELSPAVRQTCEALPATVAPYVRDDGVIRDDYFAMLDSAPRFLLQEKPRLYELADVFLRSWSDVDERWFVTTHRVAQCESDWLRSELESSVRDDDRVAALRVSATRAYKETIARIDKVLVPGEPRPPYLAGFAANEQIAYSYHGWAVLEEVLGGALGDTSALDRALLLALLSIDANPDISALALVVVIEALLDLDERELAAKVVGGSQAFARSERDKEIWESLAARLADRGTSVPGSDPLLLDEAIAAVCMERILHAHSAIRLYSERTSHVAAVKAVLRTIAALLPSAPSISGAIRQLEAQ